MNYLENNFINNNSTGVNLPREDLFIMTKTAFILNDKYDVYQKIMYQVLHAHGIDYRAVFPSHERLSQIIGVSRKKVIGILKELEELGGVCVINRVYAGTKQKISNLYYLARIDSNGFFIREDLDIVKKMYPNKVKEIDKPYRVH